MSTGELGQMAIARLLVSSSVLSVDCSDVGLRFPTQHQLNYFIKKYSLEQ